MAGVTSMTGTNSVKELVFLPNGLLGSGKTTITIKTGGSVEQELDINQVGRAVLTNKAV
jgi:hypothetical protein